jgi:hypothetical protein
MTKFNFTLLNNYKNNGQNVEQSIRFTLTGKIEKADNIAHNKGTDCLNYQIKSARATVCKGRNLGTYLNEDASKAYIYGALDGTAYIMSRQEYENFIENFGTLTRESKKNGGGEKIRLGHETKKMREWLERL